MLTQKEKKFLHIRRQKEFRAQETSLPPNISNFVHCQKCKTENGSPSLRVRYRLGQDANLYSFLTTVKILNIGTCMSEQTVKILIRLLLRSSLIRIYTVCHSFYIFWRHYFIAKLNSFILRTTTVAGLGVPIFRVFTVMVIQKLEIAVTTLPVISQRQAREFPYFTI